MDHNKSDFEKKKIIATWKIRTQIVRYVTGRTSIKFMNSKVFLYIQKKECRTGYHNI